LSKLRGDAQHLVVIALRLGRVVPAAERGERCADSLCLAFDDRGGAVEQRAGLYAAAPI
jgi:hypothetical protein